MKECIARIVPPPYKKGEAAFVDGSKLMVGDVEIGKISKIVIEGSVDSFWIATVTMLVDPPEFPMVTTIADGGSKNEDC